MLLANCSPLSTNSAFALPGWHLRLPTSSLDPVTSQQAWRSILYSRKPLTSGIRTLARCLPNACRVQVLKLGILGKNAIKSENPLQTKLRRLAAAFTLCVLASCMTNGNVRYVSHFNNVLRECEVFGPSPSTHAAGPVGDKPDSTKISCGLKSLAVAASKSPLARSTPTRMRRTRTGCSKVAT